MEQSNHRKDKTFSYSSPNIVYLGLDEAIERYFLSFHHDSNLNEAAADGEFLELVTKFRMNALLRRQIIEKEHEKSSNVNISLIHIPLIIPFYLMTKYIF